MSDYANSLQCQLLATHCCCCGRPLVDAVSVQLGIGPECREGMDGGISAEIQAKCNKLTWAAAIASVDGKISEVKEIAKEIREMGLGVLADKVERRFVNAEKNADIIITETNGFYSVVTPFRRGDKDAFIAAWRAIPSRRFDMSKKCNMVSVQHKRELWDLLKRFFPGKFGKSGDKLFRIPG